jgi:hypothetical protein
MLFQVDMVDDTGVTTESEIYDVPAELSKEMLHYLDDGHADGDLWTCLNEIRMRDEMIGKRVDRVPHERALHEVDRHTREMLMAEVLRMYHENDYLVQSVVRLKRNLAEAIRVWF